jgi:hypothetical protein
MKRIIFGLLFGFLFATQGFSQAIPFPGPGTPGAGVIFDAKATSEVYAANATTVSNTNLTIGVNSNKALVASLVVSLKTISAESCTWDVGGSNQAMSLIGVQNSTGANGRVELWGLVNPVSGNKTLTCSWTTLSPDAFLDAVSWFGVDQTGGVTTFPHSAGNTGTSTAISLTITSAPGNAAMDALASLTSISAPTKTQVYLNNASGSIVGAASSRAPGAASVVFGWTNTIIASWADVGTDIKAH